MALGTKDDYSLSVIEHLLKNFDNKIVIIYREGNPSDYILDSQIKYVKNTQEGIHPTHINEAIKETETEYVMLSNWKALPVLDDLKYAIEKLKLGYGIVDLFPNMICCLFSKDLISKIGFWDEWLTHNVEHEWDIFCRLRHYNIAYYHEHVVKVGEFRTLHGGSRAHLGNANVAKWYIKWKNTPDGYKMIFPEKNWKDKSMYKNVYPERQYLEFKDSHILERFHVERCNFWNSGINLERLVDCAHDPETAQKMRNAKFIEFERKTEKY